MLNCVAVTQMLTIAADMRRLAAAADYCVLAAAADYATTCRCCRLLLPLLQTRFAAAADYATTCRCCGLLRSSRQMGQSSCCVRRSNFVFIDCNTRPIIAELSPAYRDGEQCTIASMDPSFLNSFMHPSIHSFIHPSIHPCMLIAGTFFVISKTNQRPDHTQKTHT